MNRSLLVSLLLLAGVWSAGAKEWNVADFGALGDGKADATAAFQAALDAAAAAGGGTVNVDAGHYRIEGTLHIPGAVTLRGIFTAPPTDQREGRPKLDGSVLLAFAGRGKPDSEPFIRLAGSTAVLSGFIVTYPEWSQKDVPPVPYPPTVSAGAVADVAVFDCCFINPYEAVHFQDTARFLVRNLYGYPSYRGFYTDACYDIGRVENCHFWPFGVAYNVDDPYCAWVNLNGVAFEFARTDWQYVVNTFCFGYGVGYKFSKTKNGACNGNFLGIGADCCRRAVLVEDMQAPGLLITNGELVGRWGSTDSVGVEIAASTRDGKVSLNNCSFWGPLDKCVWLRSPDAQFTAAATHFVHWDNTGAGSPCVQLDAGKAILQGNTFGEGGLCVRVGPDVKSAILMGNQATDGFTVDNQAGPRTQLVANEASPIEWTKRARAHYRVTIGDDGDRPYVAKWFGPEKEGDGSMRWSHAESLLKLPVNPKRAYTITVEVRVPEQAADPANGVYLGTERIIDLSGKTGLVTLSDRIPRQHKDRVVLTIKVKAWKPKDSIPGSDDARELGISVRAVTMKADGTTASKFNANTGTANHGG